jgi:uncharacterized membrane protein
LKLEKIFTGGLEAMAETATGLKENIAGVLCYVLWWVTGIVFLIIEPNNKTIKFHAFQSILIFGVISILFMIVKLIPFGWRAEQILLGIVGIFAFILWVALMALASQDKKYKMPIAGDLAEKWAG